MRCIVLTFNVEDTDTIFLKLVFMVIKVCVCEIWLFEVVWTTCLSCARLSTGSFQCDSTQAKS